MSKITKTQTVFWCDFCGTEEKSTAMPLNWFRVQSVFAQEQQMIFERDAGPCDPAPDWHACRECGDKLYRWLELLGIDYTLVPAKGLYADGGPRPGNILVGVPGPHDHPSNCSGADRL